MDARSTLFGAIKMECLLLNVAYVRTKLDTGKSSGFAHSGMYPLDIILLTFDLMLFRP